MMLRYRKLSIYVIFCLLAAVVSCKKHPAKEDYKKKARENAAWKFIFTERKQYFMSLDRCDTLHTAFHYVNTTDSVQCIDTIKVACGCTAVSYAHRPIRPGESGEVKVSISMDEKAGYFSKSLAVYFHGKKPVVLKVMGKMKNR